MLFPSKISISPRTWEGDPLFGSATTVAATHPIYSFKLPTDLVLLPPSRFYSASQQSHSSFETSSKVWRSSFFFITVVKVPILFRREDTRQLRRSVRFLLQSTNTNQKVRRRVLLSQITRQASKPLPQPQSHTHQTSS